MYETRLFATSRKQTVLSTSFCVFVSTNIYPYQLLGKTLALMKKQPKTAEDYVRSAFRKVIKSRTRIPFLRGENIHKIPHLLCLDAILNMLPVFELLVIGTLIDQLTVTCYTLKQTPQTPTEVNPVLQKTLSLMTKQPKSADDYVKSAFRKVSSHASSCM